MSRPLFAKGNRGEAGIAEYRYVLTDDGKRAIVEFVARDADALLPVLNAGRGDVVAFRKGGRNRAAIEQEMKKHRSDFDLEQFDGGKLKREKQAAQPVQ